MPEFTELDNLLPSTAYLRVWEKQKLYRKNTQDVAFC